MDSKELQISNGHHLTKLYVVSYTKFAILFLSTLSFYSLYWFYKNWALYKEYTGENIWPIMRAFFAIFFIHSFFKEIDEYNHLSNENTEKQSLKNLATLFVFTYISSAILEKTAPEGLSFVFDFFILFPVTFYIIIKAQIVINCLANDNYGSTNSTFSINNYIFITLGIMLWSSIIYKVLFN